MNTARCVALMLFPLNDADRDGILSALDDVTRVKVKLSLDELGVMELPNFSLEDAELILRELAPATASGQRPDVNDLLAMNLSVLSPDVRWALFLSTPGFEKSVMFKALSSDQKRQFLALKKRGVKPAPQVAAAIMDYLAMKGRE